MSDDFFPHVKDDLSPAEQRRRKFVAEHRVRTRHTPDAFSKPWHAYTGAWMTVFEGYRPTGEPWPGHARAQTEAAAIEELAHRMGVEL